jgi:predicted permease
MHNQVVPEAPGRANVRVIARLKPGVQARQAEAAIEPVYEEVIRQRAQTGTFPPAIQRMWARHVVVETLRTGYSPQRDSFTQPLAILMGIVGLILLIACANIATLLLAKSAARQREMAIRQALGASKGRMTQQLMSESVLLSITGGAFGVLVAIWATRFLAQFVGSGPAAFLGSESAPANLSVNVDLHPDARVIAFTAALCVLTGVLFGLAPAFHWSAASRRSQLAVRASGADSLGGRFGLRRVLIVAQVAVSLVLVAGAGLFAQSLRNLRDQDLGFDRQHVLLIWANPFEVALSDAPLWNLWHDVQQRLSSMPGVTSTGISNMGLLNGFPARTGSEFFAVPGQQPRPGQMLVNQKITAGYFETVGIRLLRGRDFTPLDTDKTPPVVILNQTMARFYFVDKDPIDQPLDFVRPHNFPPYTVVGVVADTRNSLREARTGAIYYPSTQSFARGAQSMVVAVRTRGNPALLSERVRQELRSIKPDLPILKIDTVEEQIDSVLARERLVSALAEFFGLLAILLACVGLYGVLSYMVARRTNEIGVRVAVGAGTRDVLALVLRESMALVLCGAAIGAALAIAFARLISHQLFAISPSDPVTIIGSAVLMIVVGAVAGFIPALRATRVDPVVALRCD